ncbi:MAG: YaiI/YqxD family protein [Oscillospiraceae bacterium]|nr:YaiI/YqxD family protein [Oscillospiraceae bacterium]
MKILVDADACPVVAETIRTAQRFGLPVLLVCDTSHELLRAGAETLVVSKGADSADFALVSRIERGDIVVTQDYGVAAMALSRGGRPINQDGMRYTDGNIAGLLMSRHAAAKIRRSGGRLRGPRRRTPGQDEEFCRELEKLCGEETA